MDLPSAVLMVEKMVACLAVGKVASLVETTVGVMVVLLVDYLVATLVVLMVDSSAER